MGAMCDMSLHCSCRNQKNDNNLHYTLCLTPMEFINLISDNFDTDWASLSSNPNAIQWLKQNPDKIDWHELASNPNVMELFDADKINWSALSGNPAAIHVLEACPEKIDWRMLNYNSSPIAVRMLEANSEKISWLRLAHNTEAMHLIARETVESLEEQVNSEGWTSDDFWFWLSANPSAIEFLEHNPNKINWSGLSRNPKAIHLLDANPSKIDWEQLCINPAAIHLIENNKNNINWQSYTIYDNPCAMHIIVDNYDKIDEWCLEALFRNPAIFEDTIIALK